MSIDQNSQKPRIFSPSDYPHSYVASTGNKVAATLFLMLFGGLSAAALWYFATLSSFTNTTGQFILIAFSTVLLVLFLLAALSTYRFKLVLQSDRIDYQGLFSSWSINRERINNWRIRTVKNAKNLELTSTEPGSGILKCALPFKPDAAFDAWFAGLPNADLVELKESEEEIRRNPAFGNTAEERSNTAARARKLVKTFSFIGFGIAFWAILYPHPHNLPVWACLAMPWIAIVACWQSKGLYTLDPLGKRSARADLSFFILMPAFALAMRAAQNMNMLHWTEAIIPGIVAGLLLTALIGSTNNWYEKTLNKSTPYLILCAVYAIAATVLTNNLLDRSAPVSYSVKILAQRQTHGRGAASYLTVSAWGPRTTNSELVVSYVFYNSKTVGDIVCVHLHEGAYGMPWYNLGDCSAEEMSLGKGS